MQRNLKLILSALGAILSFWAIIWIFFKAWSGENFLPSLTGAAFSGIIASDLKMNVVLLIGFFLSTFGLTKRG